MGIILTGFGGKSTPKIFIYYLYKRKWNYTFIFIYLLITEAKALANL